MGSRDQWLAVLGLEPGAAESDIERAYLDLVRVLEPTRFRDDSRGRMAAQSMLRRVEEAYGQLIAGNLSDRNATSLPGRTAGPPDDRAWRIASCPHCSAVGRTTLPVGASLQCPQCGNSFGANRNEPAPPVVRQPASPALVILGVLLTLVAFGGFGWLFWSMAREEAQAPQPGQTAAAGPSQIERPPVGDGPAAYDFSGSTRASSGLVDPCTTALVRRPSDGELIGSAPTGGRGQLQIANGTKSDALAVLLDGSGDRPVAAIYIWTGSTGTIQAVPPSTYRLRFQFGDKWLPEQRFCSVHGTSEFDDLFAFDETRNDTGIEFSNFRVTLYGVPSGNAHTTGLPNVPLPIPAAR
jgi:hypothetical protein